MTSVPIEAFIALSMILFILGAMGVLLRRNAPRLDGLSAQPAALFGLQTELAKGDAIATRSVTSYTPSLAFSVLDPLGHQRHRTRPQTCLG